MLSVRCAPEGLVGDGGHSRLRGRIITLHRLRLPLVQRRSHGRGQDHTCATSHRLVQRLATHAQHHPQAVILQARMQQDPTA